MSNISNLYVMQASEANDEPYPLRCYRHLTIRMLRRYAGAATQMGHLPSMLGRCFFRAKVTSFTVHSFEDGVNFVLDMERSLDALSDREREVLARIVFERRHFTDAARMMHSCVRNLHYIFEHAVDHLTEVLLERGLLTSAMIEVRERNMRNLPARPDLRFRAACMPRKQKKQGATPGNVVSIDACQQRPSRIFAATA